MGVKIVEQADGTQVSEPTGAMIAIMRLDDRIKKIHGTSLTDTSAEIDFLLDLRNDLLALN